MFMVCGLYGIYCSQTVGIRIRRDIISRDAFHRGHPLSPSLLLENSGLNWATGDSKWQLETQLSHAVPSKFQRGSNSLMRMC